MTAMNGHSNLSRWVFEEIRDRINDGRLAAGESLSERDLGAELQVSRVPIREALPMLEAAGLVSLSPRRPAVVTRVSRSGVNQLYDIRSALEPLAARRAAAAVASGKSPERLSAALRAAAGALASGALGDFHTQSGAVHAEIEQLCENDLLGVLMDPLRERSTRLNVANIHQDPQARHAEHVSLVEAIVQGDIELASSLAHAHVEWGRRRTFETLSSVPGFDPDS
ncbi:GntR family transcriptional regulator [Rhodococcus sp. 7Tela_A2]|uniref:GntR family transcriptional regulator n=1 Tax=Rhodococcus sp. 7Tela_A2 TaxID=3093744 RepID=UPI003BB496F5